MVLLLRWCAGEMYQMSNNFIGGSGVFDNTLIRDNVSDFSEEEDNINEECEGEPSNDVTLSPFYTNINSEAFEDTNFPDGYTQERANGSQNVSSELVVGMSFESKLCVSIN
ncbi:uncharacterized protein LOC130715618 [Lotus japonicus]|uniref:uncharacterized protein LOC130715618 n=1 Tax=Lotus japonicus TaxID=34305 RepID=UPI002586B591|nr:uncharacterized protein LOC130715618 [Lotus japonicus]